jgi:FAD/FMN-containing dehydrogenase
MGLHQALAAVVGAEHVLSDPDVVAGYETDWLGRRTGSCLSVVRPADTRQVIEVVQTCRQAGVPVVPQGGNSGLVGGGTPQGGEVVVSTRRLLDPAVVDAEAGQVTLSAGTTVAQAQAVLAERGLELGVDLASRDSATIGGIVATNAGGLRVPRFGHVRQQLVGLEAVLADGSRIERLSGLLKDNSGYDLSSLLCGSEGTLGIITTARLRAWPKAHQRVTAVLGLHDLTACVRVTRRLRDRLPQLECVEAVFADGVERAVALGARRVLDERPPVELLVEASDRAGRGQSLLDDVLAALQDVPATGVAVATDARGRLELWERRERQPELVGRLGGTPLKLDTAVPLGALPGYERDVRAAVAAADPRAQLVLYGHVGDGSLHVNVAASEDRAGAVRDAVFRVVQTHQGSISAEHGIGRDKRHRLDWVRSGHEIAAMEAVKRALDPSGLFNPGVLLPASA